MIKKTFAAQELGQIGGTDGFGPWGNIGFFNDIGKAAGAFAKIISNVIGIMTIVAGIWFIFQFTIGAISWMTAGGDPKKVEEATTKFRNSIIGLVVVVLAYALISLISKILGFDILNIIGLIENLSP